MERTREKIRASLTNQSGTRRDCQHLASLVKTARRTNPVRHGRSGTLGTDTQLRELQYAVVSPAHTLTAFRRFSFWNAHKLQFSFSVSVCPTPPTWTVFLRMTRVLWSCQWMFLAGRDSPLRTTDVA